MCANEYEMKMPAHYVDMSAKEMEYGGGFAWWIASAVVSAAGWICTGVGMATNNNTLKNIGTIVTAVGIASTGYGLVTGIASAATSATFTTTAAANLAYNSSIGLADAVIGTTISVKG